MAIPLLALVRAFQNDDRGDARPSSPWPQQRPDSVTNHESEWSERVAQIRAGDSAAFEALVREYFTPLARFAFGFVRSYDVAEDIAQEVLCRVWERRSNWTPSAGVRAYLFAAARNAALNVRAHDHVVARTRLDVQGQSLTPLPSFDDVLADDLESRAVLERLRTAMRALSERQQLALHLRYEQDMAIAEVAHVLEISIRATERLLARAHRTLREALVL